MEHADCNGRCARDPSHRVALEVGVAGINRPLNSAETNQSPVSRWLTA